MADFDLDSFVSAPTVEQLDACRKDDLLKVAEHFSIPVNKQQLKRVIKSSVVQHLGELGVLLLAESSPGVDARSGAGKGEASRAAAAEGSEAKAALPPFEPFSPTESESGGDARLKTRLARIQREERERQAESRAERELRLEIRRLEIEADKEVRLRELELTARHTPVPPVHNAAVSTASGSSGTTFDVSKHISLVPQFREAEVDSYFNVFERIATALQWSRDVWPLLLQCRLTGKAQEVCAALSLEDSLDYDVVKTAILRAYELVPEAYRQRFRNHKKSAAQTYVEFAREKCVLFDKWCTSNKVSDFQTLRELILLEEFKSCIPERIVVYLNEQKVTSLTQASVFADEFTLTHKGVFSSARTEKVSPVHFTLKDQSRSKSNPTKAREDRECYYCHKPGHVIADCLALKRKQQGISTKTVAFVKTVDVAKVERCDKFDASYQPFLMEGLVSVDDKLTNLVKVTMLRDTGAMQSFIRTDALPCPEQTFCGSHVLVRGIEMSTVKVPLHEIYLKSDLFTGAVKVGVRDSLPVEGVNFILGNDIAGGKVMPLLEVCDRPELSASTDDLSEKFPEVFPVCAITRAQARKFADADDLLSTFMAPTLVNDTLMVGNGKPEEKSVVLKSDEPKLHVTRDALITAQKDDLTLHKCFSAVVSPEVAQERKTAFYMENGVLMRRWCPDDSSDAEWNVTSQIVIPVCYRQTVLSLAHDHDLSGHLGIKKTYHRILKHFFWPRLKSDVTKYCRTCQTCQFSGKPNQTIPRAPLVPVPVLGEPFEHVIVDCVGPLPKTKAGNQYLLTIMCTATRFPEAIPLRKITAPVVIKALIKFFSMFGLPRVVQTDQGTNFMSNLFAQVLKTLKISHRTSSPYHPESQGVLERFHQTLKAMFRKYCLDTGKDWDEGTPLLLFAVREAVQDSLGFSPADLVFGHCVRGPLKMLKEDMLSVQTSVKSNVLEYVSKFRERLHKACSVAKEALLNAQLTMKSHFDRKSVLRDFKEGDQVLVLLPVVGSVLSARFSGPYEVQKKISSTDYVIRTPDRRKKSRVCHVNMLKAYHVREPPLGDTGTVKQPEVANVPVPALACDVTPDCEDDGVIIRHTYQQCARFKNSEILADLDFPLAHLSDSQRRDIKDLISTFPSLFHDVPSCTTVLKHDIDVGNAIPVKQHPYRVNALKRSVMKTEVEYLIENGLAKPSCSPWSSPCLLVTKSDGTARFCTDYRKVNALTVPDCFPLPRMEDCVDTLGSAKFVSKLDLLKGYWQVPLTARASDISAFVTPDDFMQYSVMAFGMRNAPSTFQRLINIVLAGVSNCNAYLDDLVIYSTDWSEHISTLREVFSRLKNASLTLNLAKCDFGQATITYLGREVGQGQVRPIEAKVSAITEFPVPASRKELRRFLGMAGYYRNFCKNFSTVVSPLTSLLSPSRVFLWSDECQDAFENVKALLCSVPVLAAPVYDKTFKLEIDASAVGTGAVLIQEDIHGIDHPVCYFSRKFNKSQLNYSTIEKETLALLLALQYFDVYLSSSNLPITVFTDHNPLVFLSRMHNQNQRLMRWSLVVQGYHLKIEHKKGSENIMADALSRV